MKVIKPLPITTDKILYSNSSSIIPEWDSTTTYGQSSEYSRVLVLQDSNYYESLVPNNLNNSPFNDIYSTYWSKIGTISDFTIASKFWDAGISYNVGEVVLHFDTYYQSIRANNIDKEPTENLAGASPYWVEIGVRNSLAHFDTQSSTQTVAGSIFVNTINSPKIDSIALFNLDADRVYITNKSSYNGENAASWFENNSILETIGSKQINCIVFSPEKNILLAGLSTAPYIIYSYDLGKTWSTNTVFKTTEGAVSDTNINTKSIAYSKKLNKFVAVGSSVNAFPYCAIYTSSDGVEWTLRYTQLNTSVTNITSVSYIEGNINKFVCTANNSRIITSSDGNSWSQTAMPVSSLILNDITYNYYTGEIFIVASGGNIFKSTDANTWSSVSSGVASSLNSIAYSGTDYVVVGDSSTLLTSSDGTTWTNRSTLITSNLQLTGSLIGVEYCPTEKYFLLISSDPYINIIKITKNQTGSLWSSEDVSIISNSRNYKFIYYSHIHDLIIIVGDSSLFTTPNIIYYATKNLNISYVSSWYEYFFKEFSKLQEVIFQDIPVYYTNKTTIGIYGYSSVKLGVAICGYLSKLGTTQYGGSAGIIDYSKKETDEFGTTFFTKRAFSKRMNVNLLLNNGDLTRVQNLLSDLRATPSVWIGTDSSIYSPLIMYGFYKDFNLEIVYPEYSYCSLQVEGLT